MSEKNEAVFKHVLLGIELDINCDEPAPVCEKVIKLGAWLVGQGMQEVTILHSVYPDENVREIATGFIYKEHEISMRGQQALDKLVDDFLALGVKAQLVLSKDRPAVGLIRYTQTHPIDLVIIGRRNDEEIAGRRLGSVAMKALRKIPVPTWVVNPDHDEIPKRIMAATDLSEVGDQVVRFAAGLASASGAELHVVHSYGIPFQIQTHSSLEERKQFESTTKEKANSQITALIPEQIKEDTKIHIVQTSPVRAIVGLENEIDPNLLVMGTISRSGIAGMLVGNTAEKMLGRVDCSLLAIKPSDFKSPVTP